VKSKKLQTVKKEKAAGPEKTKIFPGTAVLWLIAKKTYVRPVLRIKYCSY
jgi:hypothetical protein